MSDYFNETIELGNYYKVSIYKHHDFRYEIALMSGWKYLNKYDIDYDLMEDIFGSPDVLYASSPMFVYGAMNDIYSYLKNEYPALMENVEGWQ